MTQIIKKFIHKKITFYVGLFIGLPMLFILVLISTNEFSQAIELVKNIYILITSAVSLVSAIAIILILLKVINYMNK